MAETKSQELLAYQILGFIDHLNDSLKEEVPDEGEREGQCALALLSATVHAAKKTLSKQEFLNLVEDVWDCVDGEEPSLPN